MYICPEIQLIYLAQPRTASRSVAQFLQSNTPMRRQGGHHDVDVVELKFRKDDGWRVVTAVRNHFDIIVSWYHHNPNWFSRPKGQETFANFVRDFTTNKNNQYVKPHAMFKTFQELATDIVRYETLWDDLIPVTGLAATSERPHVGASERKPYREYYDEVTRAYVEGYYQREMKKYGYEF